MILVTLAYMEGWTYGRAYICTDVHAVIAVKPNFLTSMGYHIFLTMVLSVRGAVLLCPIVGIKLKLWMERIKF